MNESQQTAPELFAVYSEDSDAAIAVFSSREIAEQVASYLKTLDFCCMHDTILVEPLTVNPDTVHGYSLHEILNHKFYWCATFEEQGPILINMQQPGEVSEKNKKKLEEKGRTKAKWHRVEMWGEPKNQGRYGTKITGEIDCILAATKKEALGIAEAAREQTRGKSSAFFASKYGVFYAGPMSIAKASMEVFDTIEECREYAKEKINGFGVDRHIRAMSYDEAAEHMQKLEEAEIIREKNIAMLSKAHIAMIPAKVIEQPEEDGEEHW